MDQKNAPAADRLDSATQDRVTRLYAGNRSPGVEARLMFPGWGPKLWERAAEQQPRVREQRYGG